MNKEIEVAIWRLDWEQGESSVLGWACGCSGQLDAEVLAPGVSSGGGGSGTCRSWDQPLRHDMGSAQHLLGFCTSNQLRGQSRARVCIFSRPWGVAVSWPCGCTVLLEEALTVCLPEASGRIGSSVPSASYFLSCRVYCLASTSTMLICP